MLPVALSIKPVAFPKIRICSNLGMHGNFSIQEKIDGINLALLYDGQDYLLYTRNNKYSLSNAPFPITPLYNAIKFLKRPAILFGELTRPNFRAGYLYGPPKYFLFDVLLPTEDGKYYNLTYDELKDFALELSLPVVPEIDKAESPILSAAPKLVLKNRLKSLVNPYAYAEGIVIKEDKRITSANPLADRIACKLKQHPRLIANKTNFGLFEEVVS